jgi:hypothetical protein
MGLNMSSPNDLPNMSAGLALPMQRDNNRSAGNVSWEKLASDSANSLFQSIWQNAIRLACRRLERFRIPTVSNSSFLNSLRSHLLNSVRCSSWGCVAFHVRRVFLTCRRSREWAVFTVSAP